LPCFIFDERQIKKEKNEYFSDNCVQFMVQSLKDLDEALKTKGSRLFCFHGNLNEILEKELIGKFQPRAVYVNDDYTPFSRKRDAEMKAVCERNKVTLQTFDDLLLIQKERFITANGSFYKIFTPFYRTALKHKVPKPEQNGFTNYAKSKDFPQLPSEFSAWDTLYTANPRVEFKGGRKEALLRLANMAKFKKYKEFRDYPNKSTTGLSAYNKFGCASSREVYWAMANELGAGHELVRQLFWRDFYHMTAHFYPHFIGNNFVAAYNNLKWSYDVNHFEAWKTGQTGCPIVDAGMRCLNATGSMHNRLRMVVATYLTKDLLIDWKWGEKYFATKLTDYDPAQNSGGWQWCASVGGDAQPYFRVFNPKLQSQKYDKDCEFILKWCPELKNVSKANIHEWDEYHKMYREKGCKYPAPVVLHDKQKQKAIDMFVVARGGKAQPEEMKNEDTDDNTDDSKGTRTTPVKKSTKASPVKRKKPSTGGVDLVNHGAPAKQNLTRYMKAMKK
jgi:deoxyribodipyrimidine photo-lyase